MTNSSENNAVNVRYADGELSYDSPSSTWSAVQGQLQGSGKGGRVEGKRSSVEVHRSKPVVVDWGEYTELQSIAGEDSERGVMARRRLFEIQRLMGLPKVNGGAGLPRW